MSCVYALFVHSFLIFNIWSEIMKHSRSLNLSEGQFRFIYFDCEWILYIYIQSDIDKYKNVV